MKKRAQPAATASNVELNSSNLSDHFIIVSSDGDTTLCRGLRLGFRGVLLRELRADREPTTCINFGTHYCLTTTHYNSRDQYDIHFIAGY